MHKNIINTLIFLCMASAVVFSRYNNDLWTYISQISLMLSCYSQDAKARNQNIVLSAVLILMIFTSTFSGPTVLTSIVLLALTLICSISKSEKTRIGSQFLCGLLTVGLIFENFSPGSLYYFNLDVTVYILMIIGALIVFNTKSVNFSSIIAMSLYCIGASFTQIQAYLLVFLLIGVLRGEIVKVANLSLLLLLWAYPGHSWEVILFLIFILPSDLTRWLDEEYKLVSYFSLGACLATSLDIEFKFFIVLCMLLISIKPFHSTKRALNV
ncbi:MAG: hypothetical protein COW01_06085 [Bdellovibrionales bacterium CG12_big_fil_rev_8_21_14_0_65_38_15]|nr:MAG: hypothetical protein COW79_03980 [Bdellovibrionales bacterium CG22_combo_CG10-13_8_21_14_all_38_13]PIQ56000.1 MAG: hypothetical protein COW01_06085 [Bdellovibrionales bacterium CG12_big_fil_rev_8_21_14_0_65_38_15]PIR30605.1 MAG: hypothetical protein COV38_04625 [Bdellovibrionales bacterium CG11_big_fil_rev_8_21_14_0_20_38_13]